MPHTLTTTGPDRHVCCVDIYFALLLERSIGRTIRAFHIWLHRRTWPWWTVVVRWTAVRDGLVTDY